MSGRHQQLALGEVLRRAREGAGLTQAGLAAKLAQLRPKSARGATGRPGTGPRLGVGSSPGWVAHIENGVKVKPLTDLAMQALKKALGRHLDAVELQAANDLLRRLRQRPNRQRAWNSASVEVTSAERTGPEARGESGGRTDNPRSDQSSAQRVQTASLTAHKSLSELLDTPMPRSLESERGVLGVMMVEPRTIADIIATVGSPQAFFSEAHSVIYTHACRLFDQHGVVHPTRLVESLGDYGVLDAVGGAAYISRLQSESPDATSATHHARAVADHHAQRELIHTAGQVLYDAFRHDHSTDPGYVRTAADMAARRFSEIANRRMTAGLTPPSQGEDNTHESAVTSTGSAPRLMTGMSELDSAIGGFRTGELIALLSQHESERTALALSIALRMALGADELDTLRQVRQPVTVGFISLKSSGESLIAQMRDALTVFGGSQAGRSQEGKSDSQLTMAPFHSVGTDSASIEIGKYKALNAGAVKLRECDVVPVTDDKGHEVLIALRRNGEIVVLDAMGRELEKQKVPYGCHILVSPDDVVRKGQTLMRWDPHYVPILAEKEGVTKYKDLVEEETCRVEDVGGGERAKVIIEHGAERTPVIEVIDSSGMVLDFHYLPVRARLEVEDGQRVRAGQVLARQPHHARTAQDLVGGRPLASENYEEAKRRRAQAALDKAPIVIDAMPGAGPFTFKVRARNLVLRHKARILFIDLDHLFSDSAGGATYGLLTNGEECRLLKALAQELRIAIVVLSGPRHGIDLDADRDSDRLGPAGPGSLASKADVVLRLAREKSVRDGLADGPSTVQLIKCHITEQRRRELKTLIPITLDRATTSDSASPQTRPAFEAASGTEPIESRVDLGS